MIVVTAEEMRALDRWTIEAGTPGPVLMERAGAAATRVLRRRLVRRAGHVVVVAGRGNNGGDGLVVARRLRRAGVRVEVWLLGRPEDVRGDAVAMLAAWRRGRGAVHPVTSTEDLRELTSRLARARGVVDALFGTGLNAQVTGLAAETVAAINGTTAPVLAIDMPSGISADTGQPLGAAIRADVTVTFGHPKVGQVVYPGIEHTGDLVVADIGIPAAALDALGSTVTLLEAPAIGRLLPSRARVAHKGTTGHVLVVGGSRGKTGAALLASEGAGRGGAGLVTLAVPATLQPALEGRVRETMTAALPDDGDGTATLADGAALRALVAGRAAVVCGPGLGVTAGTRALVAEVIRTVEVPLVLDADGLNTIAGTRALATRTGPTIVTPHPGEMARLVGSDPASVQRDRLGVARGFARRESVVVVLKGARTIIAGPDGRVAISPTGNPGMASGGMGDALAGIIGALLAQGLAAFDAASLGVFAHGAAGDAASRAGGEVGLLASDVLAALPRTVAALQEQGRHDRARRVRRGRR